MNKLPDDASLNKRLGEFLLETETRIMDLELAVEKRDKRIAELENALKEIAKPTYGTELHDTDEQRAW